MRAQLTEGTPPAAAGVTQRQTDAITVAGLRKSYGSVHAVRDVSFCVRGGEIVALLGPNGAGKTTTLEILGGSGRVMPAPSRYSASILATRRPHVSCASGPDWSCRTSRSSPT